ncbi:MAG: flippase-like domain-containing protein [Rhodothermales bacterium]|nr:flippase-like domain-containing protein [Rhodothermales bacterium]
MSAPAKDHSTAGGAEFPVISPVNVIWPVALGLTVVLVIAWITWDRETMSQLQILIDPVLLSAAVGTLFVRVLFGGWRLSFISRHRLGFWEGIRGQLAWDFSSNITPSVVGGAPLTAYYLVRESRVEDGPRVRLGEATALMTYIMLLDQVWFAMSVPAILVAVGFMEVIPSNIGMFGTWSIIAYLVGLMAYTGLFAYGTLFHPEMLGRVINRIFRLPLLRRFKDRVESEMDEFIDRVGTLRSQPADFFGRAMLLTAGTWIARYALVVFIIWSFVPNVDQILVFMRSIAMTMGSLVMPTPGGAGGIEGLYALFFGPVLPDKALLAPSLLIWRILGYYIFLAFGISISTRHIQKTVLKRQSTPSPDADES